MELAVNERLGRYVTTRYAGETVRALVPPPLPPSPPLRMGSMLRLLEEATQALGRLDGLGSVLPDLSLFIYTYVRKEAVLSSQIEGTQSSLSDLLLFELDEAPGLPTQDVQEVSNYVRALTHGLGRIREGFPLSLRLIREIHEILLSQGRGSEKDPGNFRRSQNWIGGSRPGNAVFVPPPPEFVMECMADLEKFLHEESPDLPVLVKAGLIHAQFETIHSFLDGNGRLGRLLITFLLCAAESLSEPLLYLSLYLKAQRDAYYDLLTKVRTAGAWEEWIEFFLIGVRDTSDQAVATAHDILGLFERDRKRIATLGRAAATGLRVHHHTQATPLTSISTIVERSGLSFPAVSAAIHNLCDLGVLREITGRQRHRLYVYSEYLDILTKGTEPLPIR